MLPALSIGAWGQVSGTANAFPEPFLDLYKAFEGGELQKANEAQQLINRIRGVLRTGRIWRTSKTCSARGPCWNRQTADENADRRRTTEFGAAASQSIALVNSICDFLAQRSAVCLSRNSSSKKNGLREVEPPRISICAAMPLRSPQPQMETCWPPGGKVLTNYATR